MQSMWDLEADRPVGIEFRTLNKSASTLVLSSRPIDHDIYASEVNELTE